jgi:hypothetical protein
MKIFLLTICLAIIFISCKKSDGNAVPQIKFKSITSPFISGDPITLPILKVSIKDADGDYGFKDGADSAYLYVKNVSYPPFSLDSFKFPSNLANANIKNIWAVAEIDLKNGGSGGGNSVLKRTSTTPLPSVRTDTLYFEVYMKDFKKNKSNVIRTEEPMLLVF